MAIHPATDGDNKYFGEITDLRVKEYECFSSPKVLDIAKDADLELVSFDIIGK